MAKYGSTVPMLLAQAIETLRAVGLDLPAMLTPERSSSNANGHTELDALAEEVEATSMPAPRNAPPPPDPPAERPEAPGL